MSKTDLSISEKQNICLIEAVKDFEANSYAILYSPKKCHLALFDGAKFVDENDKEINVSNVYEARIFNPDKELRWLASGENITLTDVYLKNEKDFVDTVDQKYLLWGQSTGKSNENWTQFAEARIGAFFVPIPNVADKGYAQFTAVEYLKEFEDGNVAVFEERLTGISEVENNDREIII